ncbi:MAG TPA: DMT family transporter [Rhodospirillaceae bacterium]|nr:DMT family transporter [Rhodospirillaceae bacterium]
MVTPPSHRWTPLVLVLAFGTLMGAVVPLAKLANGTGLAPPAFAFWQALGAGSLIALVSFFRRQPLRTDRRHLRFYLLAGLTGASLPNLAIYAAANHLGAGLTSLAYAFPPLFTMLLAGLLGLERLSVGRLAGLFLALAGTAIIALDGKSLPSASEPVWFLVALAAPLLLAVGNIYRTLRWPPGSPPIPLAAGMLLGGAFELLAVMPWLEHPLPVNGLAAFCVLAAIAATALAYLMFMEIQRLGGPVTLSLVGFVITPTGLAAGVLVLDERYGPTVWAATAVIFVGVAVNQLAAMRQPRPATRGRG